MSTKRDSVSLSAPEAEVVAAALVICCEGLPSIHLWHLLLLGKGVVSAKGSPRGGCPPTEPEPIVVMATMTIKQ